VIFFAFAGYARIATLAGEVVGPGRSMRRPSGSRWHHLVTYLLVAVACWGLGGAGGQRARRWCRWSTRPG
jgi:hypothetical protein